MPNKIDVFDADLQLTSLGRKVRANLTVEDAQQVDDYEEEVDDYLNSLFLV